MMEPRIERKSSIELEPRTLTLDQLQYARESALYVLETKPIEEAINIFTEGLKPVLRIRNKGMMDMDDEADETNRFPVEDVGIPMLKGMRDIVSAPSKQ